MKIGLDENRSEFMHNSDSAILPARELVQTLHPELSVKSLGTNQRLNPPNIFLVPLYYIGLYQVYRSYRSGV